MPVLLGGVTRPPSRPRRFVRLNGAPLHRAGKALRSAWRRLPPSRKLLALVALGLLLAAPWLPHPPLDQLRATVAAGGTWAIWGFFALYVALTQLPIPRTFFTIAAGVLFGPFIGACGVVLATTISAGISLPIVRRLFRPWVAPKLEDPAFAAVNARLKQRGWLAVLSLRMIAAVPFSVLNYAAALSPVRWFPFVAATAIGSAPGSIATVFMADALLSGGHPAMLAVTALLFALGLCGLVLDARLPVSAEKP